MNISDNAHVEPDKHQIGTNTSNQHRLTQKFLCRGAQTIAQAPNRPNTSPDVTQEMAHLGFRRRQRGESGTPRGQSNHRNQRNTSHRFRTSPRGAEMSRSAPAARGSDSPDELSPDAAGSESRRGGRGPGRPREQRRRPKAGQTRGGRGGRSALAARSPVATGNDGGSPPGPRRGGAARLLALVGCKWEAGVETGFPRAHS